MDNSVSVEATLGGRPLRELAPDPIRLPLVSFVLRNWNYAEYVGVAIDSIRAQDYPRFECIVVDNGSTDKSRDVIERHVGNDPRFRIVHIGENLGPMGGALRGLDEVRGEFVSFIDSDDYIFPNYASAHIQVHLALRRNVAFTSNNVIEIDGNGMVVSGARSHLGRKWEPERLGLRPAEIVLRLSTVGSKDFERLHVGTVLYHPEDRGWLWANGTANMFRKFMLDHARPSGPRETFMKMAADGHFCRICHVLGGSALIGQPLSAYRIHDRNHFANAPSVSGLNSAGGVARSHLSVRRRESARVLFEQVGEFHWRIGDRLWRAFDGMLEADGADLHAEYASPEIRNMVAAQLPRLVELFGPSATLRELRQRMKYKTLKAVIKEAYGGQVPPKLGGNLLRMEIKRAFRRRSKNP